MVIATSGKFSGRVEVSHYTLGGLPDVHHSLPYCCPVECDIGRGARRHESGAVLAALGTDFWAIPPQSGRRLPSAGRRGNAGRCRAPLWRRSDVWTLGHRDPRAGVATGGPTGRPLASPEL